MFSLFHVCAQYQPKALSQELLAKYNQCKQEWDVAQVIRTQRTQDWNWHVNDCVALCCVRYRQVFE